MLGFRLNTRETSVSINDWDTEQGGNVGHELKNSSKTPFLSRSGHLK